MDTVCLHSLVSSSITYLMLLTSFTAAKQRRDKAEVPAEQRLLHRLFYAYDTDARGVSSVKDTVTVQLQLLLLRIQGLDERSQVLTSTGLLICDWEDNRLKWDSADYNNITDIVVKPERIWLPELALMNGAEELSPDFRKIRVLLNHDGKVHWEPGGVFTTTCDIDIRYFPFDDQLCVIQFGAWAYYSSRMNITNASDTIQTHDFRLNGEWNLYRTGAEWKENVLPCCPDTRYSYVEFSLYLRRRHAFYVMNIVLPCTLLSVLVMIVFCLPPDAGEKISLGISVLLAFTVFLLMVAESIPRTSLHVSVIVIYLTCTMGLGTASVCLTVLVLNLHHRDAECPVPHLARVLILRYMAAFLGVAARKPKTAEAKRLLLQRVDQAQIKTSVSEETSSSGGGATDPKETTKRVLHHMGLIRGNGKTIRHPVRNGCNGFDITEELIVESGTVDVVDYSSDWKELAHVLDRLFFWIVFLAMTASAMIILLVPFYKEENQQ